MRKIFSVEDYTGLDPSQMADTILYCPECGREHRIPIKVAYSGNHLISKLPEVIETILTKSPDKIGIVYDRSIESKLEKLFFSEFVSLNLPFVRFPLGDYGVLLDSSVDIGNEAAAEIPKEIDILIGVGSGVICDLTKWIATRNNLPFVIMGTAASMNAYTSVSATMTENNIKTSVMLDPASTVLLDSELMASAPLDMTCAGIGDLLARNVCNADWMLSKMLRQTYFCSVPFKMMMSCQDRYLSQIDLLAKNDKVAMKSLSDAILISGFSMAILDGETSSSSGSEHVISHFFDFQHELFDLPKNLHGTQVGIGTILMSTAYDMLREINPKKLNLDVLEAQRPSLISIHNDHKKVFGEYAGKLDLTVSKKRIPDSEYRSYLKRILEMWSEIWASLDPFLMPAETIRQYLESAGAITTLSGIHRTKQDGVQALLYGSHYRQRYTILDLFWELGLFPAFAPQILEQAKVLG